ncbi:MAG: redoxin domain-containing protein [Planctomycetota bacterium]
MSTLSRHAGVLFRAAALVACLVTGGGITIANNSFGDQEIRRGPKQLRGNLAGVGQLIPDFEYEDVFGQVGKLSDHKKSHGVVIAMTGTGCPLCKKYAPTLAQIERDYRESGVAFVFINPNESEELDELREEVERLKLGGCYVRDGKKKIARVLDVKTTTEVFVLDRSRTLVYRGAVDDQYGIGYALDSPRINYLRDALDGLLNENESFVRATSSPGCEMFYEGDPANQPEQVITYHNQVSRLLNAHCVECHRSGGIGPMPFESYEQVKDYAGMIRDVVKRQVMPPWFAKPHSRNDADASEKSVPIAHWSNNRSLANHERQTLYDWIDTGAAEGDPADSPLPRNFPGGWLIGEPDAVFEFEEPVPIKANGTMPYKYINVDTNLDEDKWVQAIEVRPGKLDAVHHVIVSVRSDGQREFDERDGFWGVYVPGNSTLAYPDGMAKLLPRGAQLRFQMHYTPNGTATEDSTRIGLVFADEPPKYEVKVHGIANPRIRIPPGASNHSEVASIEIPSDVQVLSFLPHMHLRGKAARYELINRDGSEILLDIPRYDFNWQLVYQLAKPLTLRKGESIKFTGWFDNSEDNPANPDPTRTVRWGQQTEDEMHIGYVEYIVPVDSPAKSGLKKQPGPIARGIRSFGGRLLFNRLDINRDGLITREEVRKMLPNNSRASGQAFDHLDGNNDGKIDRDEFARLQS